MIIKETFGSIIVISINRPQCRNAVDASTAEMLTDAFQKFEVDEELRVAILTGRGGTFCAGADLQAFASGHGNRIQSDGPGPMGPTRMLLSKPVIAAVEGHAVAGGLELAIWCDMRVTASDATFGVFCRRLGVPLIDLGTVRLPRLIGQSRALDMILTGRPVSGEEAFQIGLANRLVAPGMALEAAMDLAKQIADFPQICMRQDRLSVYEQWHLDREEAQSNEFRHGLVSLESGEAAAGAQSFTTGRGRHGSFD